MALPCYLRRIVMVRSLWRPALISGFLGCYRNSISLSAALPLSYQTRPHIAPAHRMLSHQHCVFTTRMTTGSYRSAGPKAASAVFLLPCVWSLVAPVRRSIQFLSSILARSRSASIRAHPSWRRISSGDGGGSGSCARCSKYSRTFARSGLVVCVMCASIVWWINLDSNQDVQARLAGYSRVG